MTGVICTIKLDPFYQQFLRHQFDEFDPVFSFPKGHDLSTRFQFYLSKRGSNKPEDYGRHSFLVEVPCMDHKNAFYYNYMSPNFQSLFQSRIREFWRDVSHEVMGKWYRCGISREETILKIIEEFGFTQDDEERVRREYKRYRNKEAARRYYKSNKVLNKVKI